MLKIAGRFGAVKFSRLLAHVCNMWEGANKTKTINQINA
jgi:hypothetical protein